MVRGKYAAPGPGAPGRWSVLPGWIAQVIAAVVVLSLLDQLYVVFRLFVPDPSQNFGYPSGLPLPVRIFQWAVFGAGNGAGATTLLPAALLAWFASSRHSWTPRVSARARAVALAATTVFAMLTALRPVAVVLWLAFGDPTQMTYGMPTDNLLNFAFSSGVVASVWTALLAAVMCWVLYAARAGEVVPVNEAPDDAAEETAPDDVVGPAEPIPAAERSLGRLEPEARDLTAFRRPSRQPDPAHDEEHDSHGAFRRPG